MANTQLLAVFIVTLIVTSCAAEDVFSEPLDSRVVPIDQAQQKADVVEPDASDVIPDQEAAAGRIYRYKLPQDIGNDASQVEVRIVSGVLVGSSVLVGSGVLVASSVLVASDVLVASGVLVADNYVCDISITENVLLWSFRLNVLLVHLAFPRLVTSLYSHLLGLS